MSFADSLLRQRVDLLALRARMYAPDDLCDLLTC